MIKVFEKEILCTKCGKSGLIAIERDEEGYLRLCIVHRTRFGESKICTYLSRKLECEVCGFTSPFVLDIHHRRNGKVSILCANCHAIITRFRYRALSSVEKIEGKINRLIESYKPKNSKLFKELLLEEIEKFKNVKVDDILLKISEEITASEERDEKDS